MGSGGGDFRRSDQADARSATCPSCGTQIPVYEGYPHWCHECNWNVKAPQRELPRGTVERLYAAAGRRLGDRLARELIGADELQPKLTTAKLCAYVIAACYYLFVLALVGASALLLLAAASNVFALFAAGLMLAAAFLMRPRLGKPPNEDLVARDEAPILHRTIDDIAAALSTPAVDIVEIDHRFNASFAVLGWRRRRVLTLGLPLLAALEPRERVQLIAHELAHGRNGDARRGIFIGAAVNGLSELYRLLAPGGVGGSRTGFEPIANAVFFVFSRPVLGLLLLEYHLLLRESQRAEYLADALAASVAGTDAAIAAYEKFLLESTVYGIVREHARPGAEGDLFVDIESRTRAVPERERERRRRVARLEESRLDDTHPPTALRIHLLEGRPQQQPRVVLDPEHSAAIDRELAPFKRTFQERLVDEQRASLYY